jgi:hypothetical protein
MRRSDSDNRYVVLRGGLALPIEPILLLLDLEARGFQIASDGDALLIGPQRDLTADDCERIAKWKTHLLALIDYRPPERVQ